MKRLLVVAIAVTWALAMAGCSGGGGPSATEKDFQKLQRQYSDRFYELMGFQTGSMTVANVYQEGDRMWGEVFAGKDDLIKRRQAEILGALETSSATESQEPAEKPDAEPNAILTVNGVAYMTLAKFEADENDKTEGNRQIRWNPLNLANGGANLMRVGLGQDMNVLNILVQNGGVMWEALDKNADKPRLVLRQGPLVFTVDMVRKDNYYKLKLVRLFRLKSKGPLQIPTGTPSGTAATGSTAATTSTGTLRPVATPTGSAMLPLMGEPTPIIPTPSGTEFPATKAGGSALPTPSPAIPSKAVPGPTAPTKSGGV